MPALLHDASAILKRHQGAFIVLNLAFYGLVALFMVATLNRPELQTLFKPDIEQAFAKPGIFKTIGAVYAHRELLSAIAMTFLMNLLVASIAMATLPSFVIPFVGIFVQLGRACLWGIMFAPIGPLRLTLIPHSLTLFVEGQAYVLTAFAAYVQARQFLWPHHYGLTSRVAGYKAGAVSTLKLYVLVVVALLLAAIYEVLEAVFLMPLLLNP